MNPESFIHTQSPTGMVVEPEMNDATGEHLGYEARDLTPFASRTYEDAGLSEIELQDALGPEGYQQYLKDQMQQEATDLSQADIEQAIQQPIEADADIARAIINTETSDSYAANLVQVLSAQVYAGQLTPQEAFSEAIATGVDQGELVSAFNALVKAYNTKN